MMNDDDNAGALAASAVMDLVPSTSTGSLLASQTLDRAMAEHTLHETDGTVTKKRKSSRRLIQRAARRKPVLHSQCLNATAQIRNSEDS